MWFTHLAVVLFHGVDLHKADSECALVDSALMVEALKLRSALLKAKELILLSFHIFSDSQVFTFTLRLGSVLNEIASVLHDTVSLAKASLECMN
ncbi:hypothetical protein Bca52824_096746, partial [Brassica carinata]